MSLAHGFSSRPSTEPSHRDLRRVLVVQPNDDVCELLTEHCRRLGLETVSMADFEGYGELPDVDLIIAEPASSEGKRLLAIHSAKESTVPLLFVSVYPPVGVLSSPAVAYLVLPCSRERFEATVAKALKLTPRVFA